MQTENPNVEQKPIEDQTKTEVEVSNEHPQERNWKQFREERAAERKQLELEKKQRIEREKEAAALKAALEAALSKPEPAKEQPQYEDLTESERIRKEVDAAVEERLRQVELQRQQQEMANLPNTLKKSFSDFDSVCSTENLDYLEFHYPEVANAYKYMPDGFDKWSSIYKAVKRFIPNVDGKKEAARVDRNLAKPQSPSIPGVTQAGQPTAPITLTEQKRMENWERMQRVLRGQA